MMLRRSLALCTLVSTLIVAAPAYAQITRLGPTFAIFTAPTRGNAVAYDTRNDVYLAVGAAGTVRGRFVTADGTPLGNAFVIQGSINFTHFPRVAYSPDADNGNGAFLVTWHESEGSVAVVHCRMVSFKSGLVSGDTRIAGSSSFWEVGAAAAYSTVSHEFLITWRNFVPADIHAIRVNNSATPLGPIFAISATAGYEDNPNVAYNPLSDEFMVVFASFTSFSTLAGQRVKAGNGVLVGGPATIQQTAGIYITDVAYDSITGLYLAMWHQEAPVRGLYGRLVNPDGTPASGVGALSTRFRAYDALSVAHNRTSGTFFAISHDSITTEDGGVEIDATATPLSGGELITASGGTGNFYPRIAAHATRGEWLVTTANGFQQTLGQRIGSARLSGAPPLPPPDSSGGGGTPPPPTVQASLNRTSLAFGIIAGTNTASSGPQTVTIRMANGTSTWSVSSSLTYIDITPTSGSGPGTFTIALKAGRYSAGTDSGSVTVTVPGASNSPLSLPIKVVVSAVAGNPGGVIDTPAQNATGISGSLAITGWALDDLGVKQVTIWRDPAAGETPSANGKVFVGRAVQVENARPDVAAKFSLPFAYKAGWGYMLLTNFLPNGGNGTYTIHALAEDFDGHTVLIGSRTFTCNNDGATKPFGAIDTPDQGETISGTNYVNFGWALTPMSNSIPSDGSTIVVYIDGLPVGRPTYGQPRADIASIFPGRANSDAAVGFFQFDTTTLANGVHTIAWAVTDSGGSSEGIGSRFFNVANNTTTSSLTLERSSSAQSLAGLGPEVRLSAGTGPENGQSALALVGLAPSTVPVYSREGFDPGAPLDLVETDQNGVAQVRTGETGRVALTLGSAVVSEDGGYDGYLVTNGTLTPLPSGAFLDRKSGDFSWQPGVGFVGAYDFVFVRTEGGERRRISVQISIRN
jgi:hypothetical protein